MLLPLVLALLSIVLARFAFAFLHLSLDLTLPGLLQEALLVLLLPQTVQEFVRLGQDLRNQGVLVEVLDVKYLPAQLIILRRNRVNLRDEVLVLQVEAPVLLEVILGGLELRRLIDAADRLEVLATDFGRRDSSGVHAAAEPDLISVEHHRNRRARRVQLHLAEAVGRARLKAVLLDDAAPRQVDLLGREVAVGEVVVADEVPRTLR